MAIHGAMVIWNEGLIIKKTKKKTPHNSLFAYETILK